MRSERLSREFTTTRFEVLLSLAFDSVIYDSTTRCVKLGMQIRVDYMGIALLLLGGIPDPHRKTSVLSGSFLNSFCTDIFHRLRTTHLPVVADVVFALTSFFQFVLLLQ